MNVLVDTSVWSLALRRIALAEDDYVEAARCFNTGQQHGIQESNTDFLICAVAARRKTPVFTTDKDFASLARFLPFKLYAPR